MTKFLYWRTVIVILAYLLFCSFVAWLGVADLTAASAFILAAGGGVFGAKLGNALEAKAVNNNGKVAP